MRRIILCMFCLFFLVSTASAWEVTGTIAESGKAPVSGPPYALYPSWPVYIVHEGQPFQINCQVTGLTLLKDGFYLASFWDTPGYVDLGYLSARVPADSSGKATIQIPSLSFLTPNTTPYRVYIQYYGWDASDTHYSAYNGDVYLYVIPNTTTQVPEFPSVALPAVAVLGLMFVIGRKKN